MKHSKFLASLTAGLMTVSLVAGCDPVKSPPSSVGHDDNGAGAPDPAPGEPTPSREPITVHFYVFTNVEVVVTYNAGDGNKFIDSLSVNDDWLVGSYKGARIYISATPAKRGTHGTISVKAENATNGKLICVDSNFTNHNAGASCGKKAQ